jgi:predicted enzyme related to lactoylglutathione lyase
MFKKDNNVEKTMHLQHTSNPNGSIIPAKIGSREKRHYMARNFIRKGLFTAIFGVAGIASALAVPLQVPPLVSPPSQEHHVGKIIFVELVTPDLAAAKQFYSGLFGWTFQDIQAAGTEYAEASLDGRPVAGLIHRPVPAGEHRQPAWLSFIAVRDVEATKTVALQHGAKVLLEPRSVPNRGREAVFADPQGAVFAVLASTSGDPSDVLAAPGEWIWSSLITKDPDADAAFYQTLFDYEVYDSPPEEGEQHLTFASDNYVRASANALPASNANIHPHWINYVRVDDAVKMAAKVVSLGGRVLVEPRVDRHGGKIAIVADPSGAPFGLLEWTNTETKKVSQ